MRHLFRLRLPLGRRLSDELSDLGRCRVHALTRLGSQALSEHLPEPAQARPVRNAALGAALGAAFHMAPGLAIQNRVRAASGQSPKSTPPSTRSRNLHRPADADIVEPMTTLTAVNVAIFAPMRQHQLG